MEFDWGVGVEGLYHIYVVHQATWTSAEQQGESSAMGIKDGNRQESGYTLLQDISLSLPLIFSLLSSSQNLEIYVKFVMKSKTTAFSCKNWP